MHTIKVIILLLALCQLYNFVDGQVVPGLRNLRDTVPHKVDSLRAAVVTATVRPHMRGDTVEYDVGLLRMQPNAMVQELLRRLPGLTVGPDGSMIYNGEKIEHLLVDGVDIFGSSPSMVTRTFDAAKVARVQILDQKSDQAIFTGIDDGSRTKTINLVLKQSAKDGYFGKTEVGGNVEGNYNIQGNMSAFRHEEQLAAVVMSSNTGNTGLSNNTGPSSDLDVLSGTSDALGASAGVGVPRVDVAALHYANTRKIAESNVSVNLQHGDYFTMPLTGTQQVQIQPSGTYGEIQQSRSVNRGSGSRVDGTYDWMSNARSSFKFVVHGSSSPGQNRFSSNDSSRLNDTLVNLSSRNITDEVRQESIAGNLWWRIRIGKSPERLLSGSVGVNCVDDGTDGYLYSLNQLYQSTLAIENDTVDQRKVIKSRSIGIGYSSNYVEPLVRWMALGISYRVDYTWGELLNGTYDRGEGKYQDWVDSLSGDLRSKIVDQRLTMSLQGKLGNLKYALASDWEWYNCHLGIWGANGVSAPHVSRLEPRMILNYTFNPSTSVNFSYNTSVQQPGLTQLSPVESNSDPLHITQGNSNLKPAFRQVFAFNFHRFKTWLVSVNTRMTLVDNSISTKTVTDSVGRQISEPVNVNGGMTAGIYAALNRKVSGFDVGVQIVGTHTRTVDYINTALSKNDAYAESVGFTFARYVAYKYSISVSTNISYFDQLSSINTFAPVHYWAQRHQGSVAFYLVPGFEIGTSASYVWQQKTTAFNSGSTLLLWNGFLARNYMRNKLVVKFEYNNILNANGGLSRSNSGDINTQSVTNIQGRYWMVSAVYHFDAKFKR